MHQIYSAPTGTRVSDIMGTTWKDKVFSIKVICFILTVVNLLNYVDRGIVPGSTNEFDAFITRTIDTDTPDVYLGLLQSAFIVGFCIASIVCGHAVHYYPPFFLCGIGLSIWIVAVLFSGIALWAESYTFLLIARMLSGCGEASFQCSVPPWIQSNSEEGTQGMWLSLFYTAIPVGTAIGYVYSALISDSIGAKWAFFIEGCLMVPFVLYLFTVSHRYPTLTTRKKSASDSITEQVTDNLLNNDKQYDRDDIDSVNHKINEHEPRPSIIEELRAIFKRPMYITVALGYAAQTGSLIGVATFGSAFLMGLGFYDTETQSSSIFGIVISIGGIIGTLSGGYFLDKAIARETAKAKRARDSVELSLDGLAALNAKEAKESKVIEMREACNLIAISNSLGALCMWSVYFIYDKTLFMTMICIGCSLIFFATPGISIAAMNAVKNENRAFAMAMMSVILHGLGDVPSPVLAGLLKDHLAPSCIGSDSASDECRADGTGLRTTFLIITLWLGWTIVCFWGARFMSTRVALRCDSEDYEPNLKNTSHLDEPLIAAVH
jgi:MFS transporter, Spinster family, sphingosine-1-phosphate transporter